MLGFGALGEFPLADFDTPPAPVSIALPPVALSLALVDGAAVRAGKNFNAPTTPIAFAKLTPRALPGKNVNAPIVAIVLGAPLPKPLPGKSVGLPPFALSFDTLLPALQTGRVINLANTFAVTTEIECLGELPCGDFASDPVTTTFVRPYRIAIDIQTPAVLAGKNFTAPIVPITVQAPPPETDARSRHIRINAIAS
jgi:hypothetical protein